MRRAALDQLVQDGLISAEEGAVDTIESEGLEEGAVTRSSASDPRWESLFITKQIYRRFLRKVGNGVLQLALHTISTRASVVTRSTVDQRDQVHPEEGRNGLEHDPQEQSVTRQKLRDVLYRYRDCVRVVVPEE